MFGWTSNQKKGQTQKKPGQKTGVTAPPWDKQKRMQYPYLKMKGRGKKKGKRTIRKGQKSDPKQKLGGPRAGGKLNGDKDVTGKKRKSPRGGKRGREWGGKRILEGTRENQVIWKGRIAGRKGEKKGGPLNRSVQWQGTALIACKKPKKHSEVSCLEGKHVQK